MLEVDSCCSAHWNGDFTDFAVTTWHHFSWQVQHLVMLEVDFCCFAHWNGDFTDFAVTTWRLFFVAGTAFGDA